VSQAIAVPTNLAREEDCRSLVARAREALGPIDILVLNAGTATYGKLEELASLQPIRDAMAVNLFGAAYPTFHALDDLIARTRLRPMVPDRIDRRIYLRVNKMRSALTSEVEARHNLRQDEAA
jgi:NAD(P)-dependent dehydrogenase (short-subunit alcohol dehydrogenase family)